MIDVMYEEQDPIRDGMRKRHGLKAKFVMLMDLLT